MSKSDYYKWMEGEQTKGFALLLIAYINQLPGWFI
jgi:hypothetical protein